MKLSGYQQRNLLILTAARRTYFTRQGLFPALLSTHFFFIEEQARLLLAEALLPLIKDENDKCLLEKAIKAQRGWEHPDLFYRFIVDIEEEDRLLLRHGRLDVEKQVVHPVLGVLKERQQIEQYKNRGGDHWDEHVKSDLSFHGYPSQSAVYSVVY